MRPRTRADVALAYQRAVDSGPPMTAHEPIQEVDEETGQ